LRHQFAAERVLQQARMMANVDLMARSLFRTLDSMGSGTTCPALLCCLLSSLTLT
jgi:hypothetical protein